jgi:hypothetical protein
MRRAGWLGSLAVVTAVGGGGPLLWVWAQDDNVGEVIFVLGFGLLAIAGGITGAVVATRVPENRVGWVILCQAVGAGAILALEASALASWPGHALAAWCAEVLTIAVTYGLTGLLLLVFPTGRVLSRAWGVFAWFFVLASLAATLLDAFVTSTVGPEIPNPLLLDEGTVRDVVQAVDNALTVIGLPSLVLCATALALRLRRSSGLQRQQLKSFTYCAVMAGLGVGLSGVTNGVVSDVAWVTGTVGVLLLPVAAGLAVLRYRLYDIDVVIKRTLVYGVLTALLVATYVISVLALRVVLDSLTGTSDLAVAASTLAVAALFRPLRARVQSVVDRRFFRQQYDASRTLESFTGRLRQQVDLDAVSTDLRSVVHDTMQPAHVTLWLRRQP